MIIFEYLCVDRHYFPKHSWLFECIRISQRTPTNVKEKYIYILIKGLKYSLYEHVVK